MSVVFQDSRLLPWKRVLDNVVFGLRGGDAAERGRQALAEVGLAGRERAWPHELSGGEQQRAALARSLVREPQLLLADEPFGALDALTRIRMHALLRKLCEAHRPAVLLVTHDVDEAIVLADRVILLDAGVVRTDVRVDLPAPLPGRRRLRRATGVPARPAGRASVPQPTTRTAMSRTRKPAPQRCSCMTSGTTRRPGGCRRATRTPTALAHYQHLARIAERGEVRLASSSPTARCCGATPGAGRPASWSRPCC